MGRTKRVAVDAKLTDEAMFTRKDARLEDARRVEAWIENVDGDGLEVVTPQDILDTLGVSMYIGKVGLHLGMRRSGKSVCMMQQLQAINAHCKEDCLPMFDAAYVFTNSPVPGSWAGLLYTKNILHSRELEAEFEDALRNARECTEHNMKELHKFDPKMFTWHKLRAMEWYDVYDSCLEFISVWRIKNPHRLFILDDIIGGKDIQQLRDSPVMLQIATQGAHLCVTAVFLLQYPTALDPTTRGNIDWVVVHQQNQALSCEHIADDYLGRDPGNPLALVSKQRARELVSAVAQKNQGTMLFIHASSAGKQYYKMDVPWDTDDAADGTPESLWGGPVSVYEPLDWLAWNIGDPADKCAEIAKRLYPDK